MIPQVFSRTPLPELSHCSTLWSPQYLVRLNMMWTKYFNIYAFHLFRLELSQQQIYRKCYMKSIFSLKSTSYFGSISYLVIDSYLESISIMASTFDFYFCNQGILSHECFFSGKHFNTWKLFLTRKVIAFDAHTSVAASAETETRNWFTLERAFMEDKMRLSRTETLLTMVVMIRTMMTTTTLQRIQLILSLTSAGIN